jgi:hypothetical protein
MCWLVMAPRILPDAPIGSELGRWATDGVRRAPAGSNIVTFASPDKRYVLSVEVDDPVHGYLIQLFVTTRDDEDGNGMNTGGHEEQPPIGRTVVDDEDLALQVAAEMAAAADDLDALIDAPRTGPPTVHREDVEEDRIEPPDEWTEAGEEDAWEDALKEAYEAADVPRSKGSLTTKTIDDRQYYYLQWRDGDTVTSKYVAPVSPSSSTER